MMLIRGTVECLPLANESVDLIFTDPPYSAEFLHTYEWLAREAARVLKPGGFCMAILPGFYLPQAVATMTKYLDWFWALNIRHAGMGSIMWQKRVIVREKVLAAVSKGKSRPRCNVVSGIEGGGSDKRYHRWGQDVESARYFIDCFSHPGDLVLDPFVGGGTTGIACKLIERNFIGIDIDPVAIETTHQRFDDADIYHPLPLWAAPNTAGKRI